MNVEEYLLSCLNEQTYVQPTQQSDVIKWMSNWLSTKKYNDSYIYTLWYAYTLLMTHNNDITRNDVLSLYFENPEEFEKCYDSSLLAVYDREDDMYFINIAQIENVRHIANQMRMYLKILH